MVESEFHCLAAVLPISLVVVTPGLSGCFLPCRFFCAVPPNGEPAEELPPGYVQGDEVVSYSYVPNKRWSRQEALGILPYLFEYELFAWDDKKPLEMFHEENVRRIDLASQWSTAIMFYARKMEFRDEIIHLMIRAFHRRQLIVLRDYWRPGDAHQPFDKTRDILKTLWANRDRPIVSPEGESATGRQLINNILMVKTGDEDFCRLQTEGLGTIYRTFAERVRDWQIDDGQRPFRHIKAWYNLVGFAAWDFGSCWASGPEDLTKGRSKLPANTDCIGVDVYDYWWHGIPFDPAIPGNRAKVMDRVREWHEIRTKYFPAGVRTRVGENSRDPETWTPEFWSDTHALSNAIEFAGADKAMMIYIGLSSSLEKQTYTTPIETMDAYYNNLKEGPWVGLSWWTSVGGLHPKEYPLGTLGYVDQTLVHQTPEHPAGIPYARQELERIRQQFIASRKRMFEDVVYGQFGYLNRRASDGETASQTPIHVSNPNGVLTRTRWMRR